MAEDVREIPICDTGDLYAVWDATDGTIKLFMGRTAEGELTFQTAVPFVSPLELHAIADWANRYDLH